MKILITGGYGAMAKAGLLYILEQHDVTEVTVTGRDAAKVSEVVNWLNDPRVTDGGVLDVMDIDKSVEVFKKFDVIYNAAFVTTCLSATKAALKAGVDYVDLVATNDDMWLQKELNSEFEKIGKTAVLGLGTAPGMSQMMPAFVVDKLDSVESIHIKDACRNMTPHEESSRPLNWGYAMEAIFEEFSAPAPILIDGVVKDLAPRSMPEVVEFLPPAGKVMIACTMHPEPACMYGSWKGKGLRDASWKIGFEEEFEKKLQFLADLGFADNNRVIEVDGMQVCPRHVIMKLLNELPPETKKAADFRGHMVVYVKGIENGKLVEYVITEFATAELTKKMQAKGLFSSYRTGLYGAIGAVMLGRGQATRKGSHFPNDCLPAAVYLKECVSIGINVDVERKEVVEF